MLADSHYPDAVVTNTDELGQLAERVCASWWDRLEKNKSRKIDLQEVRRVYVGAFIASYMRGIDHKTPYEEKLARRTHMAQTGGTTMKVTKARYYDDRAVYEVGLVDRLYLMTPNNTVSFEVHFDRHGKLVLSKFDDHD